MPPVFFLHIPKTAGTNLRYYIHDAFPPQDVCYSYNPETLGFRGSTKQPICLPPRTLQAAKPAAIRKFRVVFGHVRFDGLPDVPEARFGTFLRRPMDRITSWFSHVERNNAGSQKLLSDIRGQKQSYDALIRAHRILELDNWQVRVVAGCRARFGEVSEADFKRACRNIEARFAFVGITERFSECVDLMVDKLDLPRMDIPVDMHKAPKQHRDPGAGSDAFYAKWDQKLYEYADALLSEQLDAHAQRSLAP